VSLPIFYVLQKKHVIAAIFGAFKILGQIHQIEPLLGSSSYLDILLFACHIGVGNLGLGQNLCAQQDAWKKLQAWGMMCNDGQGCCHFAPNNKL
jgi:hypothetical protein